MPFLIFFIVIPLIIAVVVYSAVAAARRFYNGNVRDYKNRCQTFPSSIVAGVFGFEGRDFFDVEPAVRQAPSAG
jgi:LemA protein